MSKRKDEEAIKNIFVGFLKETEGNDYEVVGENVPNRNGTKNFDYLLRSQSGETRIAVEITVVSDNEEEFEQRRLKDAVLSCILKIVQARSDDLPGALVIETPHTFSGAMRDLTREAESVAAEIIETTDTLTASGEVRIESSMGPFRVRLSEVGETGVLSSSFGQPTWTTHSDDVAAMSRMLGRRLTAKNEQLDTTADRRALLIGRMGGIIDREAIADALEELSGDSPNIQELYICYGDRDIERYW